MIVYSLPKNTTDEIAFQRGWAKAFGTYQGSIYPVPSEATGTLVQYAPNFRISCILPAQKRNLRISYLKLEEKSNVYEFDVPDLLLTCLIQGGSSACACPSCSNNSTLNWSLSLCHCDRCVNHDYRRGTFIRSYYIYSLGKHPDSIALGEFKFANVYGEGKICFGQQTIPYNIKTANNNFWGSTFNNDFRAAAFSHRLCLNKTNHFWNNHWTTRTRHTGNCRKEINHLCNCPCPNKNTHSFFNCDYRNGCYCTCKCPCCLGTCTCVCSCECCKKVCGCVCNCNFNDEFSQFLRGELLRSNSGVKYDQSSTILGTKFISTTEKVDGVFMSSQKSFLKRVNKDFHRIIRGNCPTVIGFAQAVPDNEWQITLEDGTTHHLGEKEVKLL